MNPFRNAISEYSWITPCQLHILTGWGGITNLNSLTKTIWQFCAEREIWLSACHLPGVENVEADFLSRNRNSDMEWKLHTQVFKSIIDIYGKCDIDLFASGLNYQFKPYASYEPDKNAAIIDAFSIQWSKKKKAPEVH